MMGFNGYYVMKIFNGEKVDVKYIRQNCFIATERGLVKGYIFVPINLNEALPMVTTEYNGKIMFKFMREKFDYKNKETKIH